MSGIGAKKRSTKVPTSGSVNSSSSYKIKKPLGSTKLSSNSATLKNSGFGQVVGQFNSMDTDGKTSKMNTPQAKCFNNGAIVGSPFSSINYDIEEKEKAWIDPKIIKTQVEVAVKKSFALDINLSAVEGKLAMAKTHVIKKLFSGINGFGRATISSKFEGIIRSTFISEASMEKAILLARKNNITVNSDLTRQEIRSDRTKAVVEFAKLEQAVSLAAKWSFLIGKDLVRVAIAVGDHDTWASRDQFRALLFTLPVGTTAHDLNDLLDGTGRKSCIINCSLKTGNKFRCAVVGFKSNKVLESAFHMEPIFGGVKLSWARLDLVRYEWYGKFSHSTLECDVEITSTSKSSKSFKRVVSDENCLQLAQLYAKKDVSITRLVAFDGKLWAQVVSLVSSSNNPHFGFDPGFGFFSSGVSGVIGPSSYMVSASTSLKACLAFLEYSVKFFVDKMSGIVSKLKNLVLVPPALTSSSQNLVVPVVITVEIDSDMALDDPKPVLLPSSFVSSSTSNLGLSSSKILISKVGCLESKLMALEASVCSVLEKFDQICTGSDSAMNNLSKQADIIYWHMSMDNMVSIIIETKLKGKVCSWIANRFAGVWVFISGLDSGHLGLGVAIIINIALAKHVCKVSEVSGCLISVRLLFKNKLSVSILGLYAGVLALVCFSQADDVNALIAGAVNDSSFVVLGGDFNEDGLCRSASFKKCGSLDLINSFSVTKAIDYFFVSPNLVNTIVDHNILDVVNFFDTDHQAIFASIGLGGLLDTQLCSIRKQSKFKDETVANAAMFSVDFMAARELLDLDVIWDAVHKIMCFSVDVVLKKKWFKDYDGIFTKCSSRFHKLELLVFKLVKTSHSVDCDEFILLLNTWELLNSVYAAVVRFFFLSKSPFDDIHLALSKARKSYHASKLSEVKCAEALQIKFAINKRIESFESNKSHTIRSVLERPFCKVVLDHLVVGDELYLEPGSVKTKTRKRRVVLDILGDWSHQYQPLEYVFDGAFSDVMSCVSFDEMFGMVSNLPDGKATGLSGISNELWKYCDKSVLDMLLVLINFCLCGELILSDRISLTCSKFNVLCGDNFSVLKGITTQSPIFAIGSVIKDVLEKDWELWLVLQDMRKAYDLVGWEHLKKSLVRIKMCCKFIRFFGDIHGGWEVFSPLLWHIFYNPLLCKVKRQKSVCNYRLISHFIAKMGCIEFQAGLSSFFAAGAFVDDMIWVGSSQAATQLILNVASEFFYINDIFINNDKTVVIPINTRASAPSFFISGSPISIVKSGESHHYLGIFLSSKRLLKPSLVKAHSDVCFFTNLVLKKAVLNKQFLYLVSAVLYLIIDALIRKDLKSKSGLPLDFPSDTIHHPSFYELKSFAQIQSESKVTSFICFANSVGILGHLFSHRSHDLQVSCWHPVYSLSIPVHLYGRVSMFAVFSEFRFIKFLSSLQQYGIAFWKRLDPCGLTFEWFVLSVEFLLGMSSSCAPPPALVGESLQNILDSPGSVLVYDQLFQVLSGNISVYTDGSLMNLSTENCTAGAGVFFSDIDLGLGIGVLGLLSSTLVEMQAIVLALECVFYFSSVYLFSNSQAALDCLVEWHKVKDHSGVIGNEHADIIAGVSSHSGWFLPLQLNARFLLADGSVVSSNSRYFVCNIFCSVCHAYWEIGSDSKFLPASLLADVDWFCFSLVWHLDSHMAAGHTSRPTADAHTFFIKTLHHWLSVAVQKHLYNRWYPSILCLYCGKMETSDHVFSWFVFSKWFHEAVSVFKAPKVASLNIVEFVHSLGLTFRSDIWLIRVKHRVFMKRNNLIPLNSSFSISVFGSASRFSAGVVRLLGMTDALGVCFGFRKYCSFFSSIGDSVLYDKTKLFFDFKTTVGPNIIIMKKIAKNSGASGGFKPVLSRKKRKDVSLEESVDRSGVPTEVSSEKECLVEEISFDYGKNGNITDKNHVQTPKKPGVKTMKALDKPLEKINFLGQDENDDAFLDVSLVFLPPLKNLVTVSVQKSFAMDIGLNKVAGKSSQKKLAVVRKLFSKVNSFEGASTSSKFSGIICASFTFEASLAQITEKARAADILVNINLKKSTDFIGFVGGKTCVIDQHSITYAWARCVVVCFDSAASINAVMKTTSVLKGANLDWFYMDFAKCAKCENLGYTSLNCFVGGKTPSGGPTCKILSNDDKSRLASIYARHFAPISHSVSFASFGFSSEIKPTLMVSMELNDRFAALEHSLASLTEHVDKLAKRLNSLGPMVSQPSSKCQPLVTPLSQNQGVDIVMSEGSGVATSGETIARMAVCDSSVVSKIEETLKNLLIMVMDLLAKINNAGLFATYNVRGLNVPAKQEDIVCWHKKFGNMVSIIMETKLRSNIKEVLSHTISVHFLFKGKISVLVVGLYACVSLGDWFRQVPSINSFIAQVVNSSSFIVLGSDFNESKSKRSVSFSFCLSLDLVNSFGVEKVIDYIFVSGSLILAVASCRVESVTEFFDTDHRAVLVSMGLSGLLNMYLDGIHKNANKDCWKFKLKNVDTDGWKHFMECSSAKFLKRSGVFHNVEHSGNLNDIWNVLRNVIIDSADMIFSRLWFSEFNSIRNKASSRFHGLEMLMFKIMDLDVDRTLLLEVRVMINGNTKTEDIVRHISVVKKEYHKSKYYKSRVVRDESIRVAVAKYMENFYSDKERMIKSILNWPFRKVILNHLIVDDELILEPQAVKSLVDTIIENYINNNAFSEVMCNINLDELLVIVKKLPNSKTAGFFGIPNKLWKHNGSLALNGLLNILNRCLKSGSVPTQPIVLIETAWKILSKILSDRIFLVCSRYDILHGDNFSVLKGTSIQFFIFAVGSIVKDALEKNRELWLVLQDMCKAYDSFNQNQDVSSLHNFFGGIHNGRFNQIMTDFGLSDGYIVHNSLNQEEMFLPLLWRIFYDPLLCEVKKYEQLYGYKMCSKFYTKSGKANLSSNSTLFFAAGAFVDDTLWIGNCLMVMQNILNIANEFFFINDISINTDKTVIIPINQDVRDAELFISGSKISVAKKSDSHQYLGIFLFTELSKPSLAKTHGNIRFFSNVILKKTITEKQFLYLVSTVLLQFSFTSKSVCKKWDKLLRKEFKLKANLSKDFPSIALHHPMLYGLKPFEQVLTESLMANLVNFSNTGGAFGVISDYLGSQDK
ncbi:hypothetical protein G9A89_014922 [Geosiphon pyriformis]|nr:hypothetical protein G9A89_014922 [Geosiphon pyriformis]